MYSLAHGNDLELTWKAAPINSAVTWQKGFTACGFGVSAFAGLPATTSRSLRKRCARPFGSMDV